MSRILGLILAGGSGVRLWPRSREELPKQFLSLRKGNTMLQDTVTRMLNVLPAENLYAVAGGRWAALVSYHGLILEQDIDSLTKSRASKIIDGIISEHGKLPYKK